MDLDAITAFYASISVDWTIIGVFAILAAFDALRVGARRACTLALALPAAALFVESLTNAAFLGSVIEQFSTPVLGAILFFIIFAVVYILIGRMGFSWGGEAGKTLQSALAGVAATALLVTFWVNIPALDTLWHFGPQIQTIFGEGYRFWWLIGSYAALAFVRNT